MPNGAGSMNSPAARTAPGDAGISCTDRERHQRVGGDIHARTFRTNRVVAQRRERASHGEAQQRSQRGTSDQRDQQHQKVEGQIAFKGKPKAPGA